METVGKPPATFNTNLCSLAAIFIDLLCGDTFGHQHDVVRVYGSTHITKPIDQHIDIMYGLRTAIYKLQLELRVINQRCDGLRIVSGLIEFLNLRLCKGLRYLLAIMYIMIWFVGNWY